MEQSKEFRSPKRESTTNKNPIPHLRGEVKWGKLLLKCESNSEIISHVRREQAESISHKYGFPLELGVATPKVAR